jgi:hypothetical protein
MLLVNTFCPLFSQVKCCGYNSSEGALPTMGTRVRHRPLVTYTVTRFYFHHTCWLMHYATRRKVAGSIPDDVIGFFNGPNPSSRTMALGSTQPLTEMSTGNFPGSKGRPAREADNLTAICEPNV